MVDAGNMEPHREKWLDALRSMTATPEMAANYLDRRLRFTTLVAQSLIHDDAQFDNLVYGVWLNDHASPVYIGQTSEGRRRLWDLPIGESHHLANSFPPEIWHRVVVVYWRQILASNAVLAEKLTQLIGAEALSSIGLGLEYLLQTRYQPLLNRRKKKRDGRWREVVWTSSNSVGSRVAPFLDELFQLVIGVWDRLVNSAVPSGGVLAVDGGRVVFPAALVGADRDGDRIGLLAPETDDIGQYEAFRGRNKRDCRPAIE